MTLSPGGTASGGAGGASGGGSASAAVESGTFAPRSASRPAARESARETPRHRRPFSDALLHAPQTLRALVRADEIWLVGVAAVIGMLAGILVAAMNWTAQWMHQIFFALESGARLSSLVEIDPLRAVVVPTVGGLAVGLFAWGLARWWRRQAVDPIEANALYGGRMSLTDSVIVVIQTLMSNGVGASIGLEAGYTQIGSAVASRIGRAFRVRRNDLRVLVGCGAAGAISAAFNGPLTGAFYAFELVIGTYAPAALAPVVVAAITAWLTIHAIPFAYVTTFDLQVPTRIALIDYIPILALGMVCALVGIAIMRGVTLTEQSFRRSGVPVWLRPVIGGLVVGTLALVAPQVLSSGHAALHVGMDAPYPLAHLALLIVLKSIASAVSIGAGFRGGLFFASLFLGALVGKLFAAVLAAVSATGALPPVVCAIVGMSALAVAVIGGPLTMSFLALESTGSLPITAAVVAASVISALTVRRTFGYSFATWRFHLRGEAIRSAVDIGWMRNLTVGKMMRREVRTCNAEMQLAAFRREFPLGSVSRVVALDEAGRYAGIVLPSEAHADLDAATHVSEILHNQQTTLRPEMSIKEAVSLFETAETDALAVVDGTQSMRVLGVLTEQYALRRYTEELDRRRRELSGE
jgi:CIC family chloride channel protein